MLYIASFILGAVFGYAACWIDSFVEGMDDRRRAGQEQL